MPDEILKQIFDPFFTTKKGGKGTGLGLALVEQIISSHKGYIFAESHPGEGSIFHIYLPVNEQKDGDEPDGELECNEAGEKLLNLLIVDDNPKVLKLLEKDFGRLGIAVTACMSYDEARNHLRGGNSTQWRRSRVLAAEARLISVCRFRGSVPDCRELS